MNRRLEELYNEELEKDISRKLNEKGYELIDCKIDVKIGDEETTKINKIKLSIEKVETSNDDREESSNEEGLEGKIVTEIEKIKKVDTKVKNENESDTEEKIKTDKTKLTEQEKQEVRKFLSEEYEVEEKCLEIN